MSYPHYKYKLTYSVLRQGDGFSEFSQLVGFYNARSGGFDPFLFTDPDDNSATAQIIGQGDASNKLFQLVRGFGGYIEPVFATNSTPQISVDGVLKTPGVDYTISASGLITFVVAPPSGKLITWTGTFYRRMLFSQDSNDFARFLANLWELKTLELETVKL